MSMHSQTDEKDLEKALENHGLSTSLPSQLADAFRTGWRAKESGLDTATSLRDQLAMSAPDVPSWYHHKDERHYTEGLTGCQETLARRQWSLDRITSWRYAYADAMLVARDGNNADRITALEDENKRLREALEIVAGGDTRDYTDNYLIARAALEANQ
jgi:bisphosphoglycerate-dependent phosphoglycerate mutase